jgi:hypothetical protein
MLLFVPIISALIMENLKEDPEEEEEEELNTENAFYPEQSCSEEDQSDGYASFVSFNFFVVCFYLEINQLCRICNLTSEYLQRFKGVLP